MRYHVLSIENLCFQTTNRHNLRSDRCARCVIKWCFSWLFSARCMCSSCRIGEIVQSVGHRPSVCLL